MTRTPSLFIGHGAPTVALDPIKGAPFAALGAELHDVSAVLVVSAHWERAPITLGTVETRPLIYDFGGFPPELYRVPYPSPGAPALASRVKALLGADTAEMPTRGLDHGVWTPLVHMFPAADKPVLQLSMPSALGARAVLALGEKLKALRDEGVLLMASGNITHNLRAIAPEGRPPEAVFVEFDTWAKERSEAHDVDALVDAAAKAPGYRMNHPTPDHYLPLLFALGASDTKDTVSFPVQGWEYGNLSRRAVRFG